MLSCEKLNKSYQHMLVADDNLCVYYVFGVVILYSGEWPRTISLGLLGLRIYRLTKQTR